jgi:hypothetical protein
MARAALIVRRIALLLGRNKLSASPCPLSNGFLAHDLALDFRAAQELQRRCKYTVLSAGFTDCSKTKIRIRAPLQRCRKSPEKSDAPLGAAHQFEKLMASPQPK